MVGKTNHPSGCVLLLILFLRNVVKKHNNPHYIFVLAPDGQPIMPTLRGGRVRWLLKTGQAKVIKRIPFTIQILYESVGRETQDITLGADTGTGNIGISAVSKEVGTEYFSASYETNTQKIKPKMERRADFRHTRTRFNRGKKKRRAKANGTTRSSLQSFTVSGAETETVAKTIRSSRCRLDKSVANGKLSNTAQHALINHQNIINQITKILPITEIVFELTSFDIHKITNPAVSGVDYQNGDLMGFANVREYVLTRDKYCCALCNKKKKDEPLHVHHIQHRSKEGSDHHTNLITLHESCHNNVHAQPKVEAKLLALLAKKETVNTVTAPATIMNTIMPRIAPWLAVAHPNVATSVTFGYITKAHRFQFNIEKSHANDAFVIASGENAMGIKRCESATFKQFNRNSRVWIYGTKARKYTHLLANGKKIVCYNRNRATAQDEAKLSLADFREKYGKKAVSTLKVVKGTRMWLDNSGYQFSKGDTIFYKGKSDVVQGNSNGGTYLRLASDPKKNVKPRDCRLIQRVTGFVRVA